MKSKHRFKIKMETSTLKSLIRQLVNEAKFDDYGTGPGLAPTGVNPEYRSSMPYDIAVKLLTLAEKERDHLGPAISDAIIASSPDKLIALAAVIGGYPKDARSLRSQIEMLQDLMNSQQPRKSSNIDKFF